MAKKKENKTTSCPFKSCLSILVILIALFFFKVSLMPRLPLIGKSTDSKIYIALGFHTSLYHSYRGDTFDEAGFGKDIRIIRKIIDVMDEYNEAGSKVRAVWDIDNLFTLEEILPEYAPDIIERIKRRVVDGEDEVILMSYDNGCYSAMTEREFIDNVNMAITNKAGSGVLDIFGEYTPIIRPQEGMFGPGNFGLSRELGIEAVALYYSAIPFDNMRVFIRPLSFEEAFNPLTYINEETGEELMVIPSYNVGDLIENVSITRWTREIHREQLKGNVDGDVLIFINFDADDSYWFGYDLPVYLSWLPNTGGLTQLIDEVDAIDYVEFTTLSEYLETHESKGEVSFGQDTADGNFDGYDPWSEKATTHEYWTRLMEDRRNHVATRLTYNALGVDSLPTEVKSLLDSSYELRLRLLSTTHFGMAAPLLAKDREKATIKIIDEMLELSREARDIAEGSLTQDLKNLIPPKLSHADLIFIDSFMPLSSIEGVDSSDIAFISFDMTGLGIKNEALYIIDSDGEMTIPFVVDTGLDETGDITKVRLFAQGLKGETPYFLFSGPSDIYPIDTPDTNADTNVLSNDYVKLEFDEDSIVSGVFFGDLEHIDYRSFLPRIVYRKDGKELELSPEKLNVKVERDGSGGVARIRLSGDFDFPAIPGTEPGFVDYHFTLISGIPYLFLEGHIAYPETPKNDYLGLGQPISLLRKIDTGWYEVVPAELILTAETDKEAPFEIIKRSFLGVESSYILDYFKHSD